jgi:hypothetical protein
MDNDLEEAVRKLAYSKWEGHVGAGEDDGADSGTDQPRGGEPRPFGPGELASANPAVHGAFPEGNNRRK